MSEPTTTDWEDENRKLRAEIRALTHQRNDLQEELKAHRWFVRMSAAVFSAMEGIKSHHAALYAAEKRRPLAALPAAVSILQTVNEEVSE